MKTIKILKKLNRETTAEVFYAGEFARDIIRRRKPKYLEVLVRNLPLRNIVRYLKKYGTITEVNKDEGFIVFISKENGNAIKISLPKKGRRYSAYYELSDDAKARDFTINAMYLPINSKSKLDVVDFFDSCRDIRLRRIKTVRSPKYSIREDPAIMLKAVSISAALHYKIDVNLFYSIKSNHFLVDKLSAENIRDELIKILLSDKPSKCFKTLYKLGLLNTIMPELCIAVGVMQKEKYHKYDVFDHCIYACDKVEPNLMLRLAALLHDIGKPQARDEIANKSGKPKITFYNHEVMGSKIAKKILKRLKFSPPIISQVTELIYHHMYNYEPNEWTNAAVRRFIKKIKITDEDLKDLANLPLFLVRRADRLANGLSLKAISYRQRMFEERIREIYNKSKVLDVGDLAIDGNMIMEKFNLKPGPTIGSILNHLLGIVIEDQKINEKDLLIEAASNYLSEALK